MKLKERQKNNGITLIALVITIIVLLILVGVTIATLLGDNGVLTKATEAKNEQADATVEEAIKLAWNEYQMMLNEPTGEKSESGTKIASTSKVKIQGQEENYSSTPTMTFWQFLEEEKHYINEQGIINVETLIGETLSRGNGTDGKDVYKIEETENNGYVLVYCDENNNRKELSTFEPGDSEMLEETDESYFEITEEGEIWLKKYGDYYNNRLDDTMESLVIPDEIDGKKVTAIADDFMRKLGNAFKNLKIIVIPNGVTIIGESAFESMYPVEKIVIPDSVTKIGTGAFAGCSLKSIQFPNQLTVIEGGLLQGCESLTNIVIPSNVISIGDYAFSHCTSVKNIIIPSSVTNMGYYVFNGWESNQSICIEFSESEIPDTWSVEWNKDCDAHILFKEELEYFTFAQEYLASKKREELEELILKTVGYPGTFEEFLTEIGMTREEWEQQGADEGLSYIEWLRKFLIYGNGFSWVQVEYEVSKNGGAGKTLGELETIFAQQNDAQTFEEYLSNRNMTREQFEEEIKNQGFRTEEDYLKYHLYYPA